MQSMAHDPRQAVIDMLSAPLSTSERSLPIAGDTSSRRGAVYTSGGIGAVTSSIRVLKERTVPLHYASLVAFEDVWGQSWEFACFVVQEGHNWVFKSGGSVSQVHNEARPHVSFAGGWGEGGFSAGGRVHANGAEITRVDLVSVDGIVFDDSVDDGLVLFVTDREDIFPPVRALLYDSKGVLVGSQVVFERVEET